MEKHINNKVFNDDRWNQMFSDFGLKPFEEHEINYVRDQAKQAYDQYEKFVRQLNTMLATNKHIKLTSQEGKTINNQLSIEDYETTQQPKGL